MATQIDWHSSIYQLFAEENPKDTPSPLLNWQPPDPEYWPTKSWRKRTPEQVGMNSGKLLEMLRAIEKSAYEFHTLLVIRKGYLVLEVYYPPYHKDFLHVYHSASKSFTQAAIGLAHAEKQIPALDTPLAKLLPVKGLNLRDQKGYKRQMTLRHALAMRTGHRADSAPTTMPDFFAQPVDHQPGTRFLYTSAASHALSLVFTQSTKESVQEYLERRVFKPIGIRDYFWTNRHSKILESKVSFGHCCLHLYPRDAARFAFLYLNQGTWNQKQILPRSWILESTSKHTDNAWGGYGYQFWLYDEFARYKIIAAVGLNRQLIYIVPELDLIMVMNANFNDRSDDIMFPLELLRDYIWKSIKSNEPIEGNAAAYHQLSEAIHKLQNPHATSPLPELLNSAKRISGREIIVDGPKNPDQIKRFTLHFESKSECRLNTTDPFFTGYWKNQPLDISIGLDNIFRNQQVKNYLGTLPVAARGEWQGLNTFYFETHEAGNVRKFWLKLSPSNKVQLKVQNMSEEYNLSGQVL